MKKRTAKNERHMDVTGIGANHWAIEAQGLSYFFGENPSYNKALVAEFYKNMKIPEVGAERAPNVAVASRVGRIEVLVNHYEIATALDYQRPEAHEMNYPRENFATPYDIAQDLYINPAEAEDPHVPGKFKPEYKLLNKFVHHNINPRGTENKPNEEEGELLFAFAQPGLKANWVEYIFGQIVEFKIVAALQTRMPYPCLIKKICRKYGVTGQKYAEKTKLEPGVINSNILTRSTSQSRAPRNLPGGTYLTSMSARGAPKPTWYKKLFCQGVSIIGSLRKGKKEHREMARRQARMDHRLEWLTRQAEGSTSEPYAPPPIVEEEDSDDLRGMEPAWDDGE